MPRTLIRFAVLFGGVLLLGIQPTRAITFDGATTYQTIDGLGVNLNYRGWEGTNLMPVFKAYMEDAGATLFRVPFDLSDWETTNDDTNSETFNWTYYNSVYSSPEFNRLWEMLEALNNRGYSNRVCLTFMGWGPEWMMDTNGRSLKADMEDEWAEMIASAIIYARNTRGLTIGLVAPNNEPDIPDEGIQILSTSQYTNTLHRLVLKLDQNGITNLTFVGPDLSKRVNVPSYLSAMLQDPTIMGRTKHIGVHSYSSGADVSDVISVLGGTPYEGRPVWVTEFNEWCSTCDDGVLPDLGWGYTRTTAEYLLNHLQRGASATLAWEGYDSIYAHHYTNWGFFGLMAVDDLSATNKTYTPRKNFYTTATISKWVRPGAQRIDVSSQGSFLNLVAFKHDALGQVTISGINPGSSSSSLSGKLNSLPSVSQLELYYTTSATNLAKGAAVGVNGSGNFTASIPGDCVFTLTGNTAQPLTNGIPMMGTSSPGALQHFYIDITNPVERAQFEVNAPSHPVSLFVQKNLPSDGETLVHYRSLNPGTNTQMIVVRPGNGPHTLSPGRWYLSVRNDSSTNASFSVKATLWNESGTPLLMDGLTLDDSAVCFSWNALPGATYVVQGATSESLDSWSDLSGTLLTTNTVGNFCHPLPSPYRFFRVLEGVSLGNL